MKSELNTKPEKDKIEPGVRKNINAETLSPLVYWAQTDVKITLKVDLKDAKVLM